MLDNPVSRHKLASRSARRKSVAPDDSRWRARRHPPRKDSRHLDNPTVAVLKVITGDAPVPPAIPAPGVLQDSRWTEADRDLPTSVPKGLPRVPVPIRSAGLVGNPPGLTVPDVARCSRRVPKVRARGRRPTVVWTAMLPVRVPQVLVSSRQVQRRVPTSSAVPVPAPELEPPAVARSSRQALKGQGRAELTAALKAQPLAPDPRALDCRRQAQRRVPIPSAAPVPIPGPESPAVARSNRRGLKGQGRAGRCAAWMGRALARGPWIRTAACPRTPADALVPWGLIPGLATGWGGPEPPAELREALAIPEPRIPKIAIPEVAMASRGRLAPYKSSRGRSSARERFFNPAANRRTFAGVLLLDPSPLEKLAWGRSDCCSTRCASVLPARRSLPWSRCRSGCWDR